MPKFWEPTRLQEQQGASAGERGETGALAGSWYPGWILSPPKCLCGPTAVHVGTAGQSLQSAGAVGFGKSGSISLLSGEWNFVVTPQGLQGGGCWATPPLPLPPLSPNPWPPASPCTLVHHKEWEVGTGNRETGRVREGGQEEPPA